MKEIVYVAGPSADAGVARVAARHLTSLGHEVVSTWHNFESVPDDCLSDGEHAGVARRCLAELESATLVYFVDSSKPSRGRFVELGLCIGLGKRVRLPVDKRQLGAFAAIVNAAEVAP